MKHVTEQQIKELVLSLTKDNDIYISSVEEFQVKFIKNTDKEVLFEVTQMYSSPLNKSFKTLKAFSELFGTDTVDVYDDISHQGCETCDYGSSYGYAIRVWE